MVGFSRKTDIALMVLSALTERRQRFTSVRTLSRERHLPYRFASQVIGLLTRAGILEAREGVNGGYRLVKSPREITVAEVVTAAEGGLALTACVNPEKQCACPQKQWCAAKEGVAMLQQQLQRLFGSVTLAEFVRHHHAAPRG